MRHTSTFNDFLRGVVDLPQARLEQLNTNVNALYGALCNAETFGPHVLGKIPQGSWAHRTIIRPVDDLEFDADFLLRISEHPVWSNNPQEYLDQLEAALRAHGVYADMVENDIKSRCVRVVYADEHHVDIVPYLILAGGRKVIVHRDVNDWEDTDPEGFTGWMREHDTTANGNMRRVIRLIKFLRDYHDAFPDVPSIIITKLVGDTITTAKKLNGLYGDVPATLSQVMADLDAFLQANTEKPSVEDPSGACDPEGNPVTFDHRWSAVTYQSFRTSVNKYAAQISAAYFDPDEQSSLAQWQSIFGDGFTASTPTKPAPSPFGAAVVVPASTAASRGG